MQIVEKRLYAAYLMLPCLFPHLLFYFFSKNKQAIKSDMGGVKNIIYHLVYDKPYRNVFYYRLGRKHFLFSWMLPRCTYTRINQNMNIGNNFYMEHAFNTFLNAKEIGCHFRCYHNVTVGQKGGKIPTIGNHVTVSCGASILGNVTIGNNVIIGAGCVVTKDLPDNCTVVGNPARIVRLNGVKVMINL